MPRMELEDERGRYEAVIPEEPDTRKLRILRDWLDLGIRDYEPTSDRCDECEKTRRGDEVQEEAVGDRRRGATARRRPRSGGTSRSRAAFCA